MLQELSPHWSRPDYDPRLPILDNWRALPLHDGFTRIPPASGVGFRLPAGATLTVLDPHGEQVSDLIAFDAGDLDHVLSAGRTLDYNATLRLTTGHTLFSNRSVEMLTIVDDDCGRHDILLSPCSQPMYERLYNWRGHHPSCLENLAEGLRPFGVRADQIVATFNIFMRVDTDNDTGRVDVLPPVSRAGDALTLRAEMDLFVGLTACAAEGTNNRLLKPIDFRVRAQAG